MYQKGSLKILTSPCEESYKSYDDFGVYDCSCGEEHQIIDSSTYNTVFSGTAYLPHSCEEWVIGGKNEIIALIVDLTEALKEC